jgi:isoamyl acetate esterase
MLTHPCLKTHNPDIKLVLIGPPPICEYRCADRPPPITKFRTAENTAKYARAAKDLAADLGVVYVDLWTGFLVEAGWREGTPLLGSTNVEKNAELGELLPDGLHFSRRGNDVCAGFVREGLRAAGVKSEVVEKVVPGWDDERVFEVLEERLKALGLDEENLRLERLIEI